MEQLWEYTLAPDTDLIGRLFAIILLAASIVLTVVGLAMLDRRGWLSKLNDFFVEWRARKLVERVRRDRR